MSATNAVTPAAPAATRPVKQQLLYRVGCVGLAFFAIKGVAWIVLAVTAWLLAGR